jgi:hypothetical protein
MRDSTPMFKKGFKPIMGPVAHDPYTISRAFQVGEAKDKAMTSKRNSDYGKAMESAMKNSKEIGRIRSFDPSK